MLKLVYFTNIYTNERDTRYPIVLATNIVTWFVFVILCCVVYILIWSSADHVQGDSLHCVRAIINDVLPF